MKTLNELIELELIAHETKLRGDDLEAEFQRRKSLPVKPFYVHDVGKQERFYQGMYKQLYDTADNPPPFREWLGERICEFIYM